MKILHAAALVALLAAPAVLASPACAQETPHVNLVPELVSKTPEQVEQEKVAEKAYRDSLRKIPDAKASADPWGNVRSADAPKAAQAKPKAKTGSAAN